MIGTGKINAGVVEASSVGTSATLPVSRTSTRTDRFLQQDLASSPLLVIRLLPQPLQRSGGRRTRRSRFCLGQEIRPQRLAELRAFVDIRHVMHSRHHTVLPYPVGQQLELGRDIISYPGADEVGQDVRQKIALRRVPGRKTPVTRSEEYGLDQR